jgi:hypothetical protein
MSFDLAVWYSDVASTSEQAGEIYANLCDGKRMASGGSASVNAFYDELIAKWQEIDSVPKEFIDDLDRCPWSCALDHSPTHVVMSCVWSRAPMVVVFVAELAAKHGLVLFDPQGGTVILPPHLNAPE